MDKMTFLPNFECVYLGEKWRPNKNKKCSELLTSWAITTEKIAKIGVVPINCNFSKGAAKDYS
jgi:hypothetical protein